MFEETVFYGLHPMLKRLNEERRGVDLAYAEVLCRQHFGADHFNHDGWKYLNDKYPSSLPLHIKSVPEGTVVPTGNVLMTIENTDPKVPWLTNWVETQLMQIWYPITVVTLAREIKKVLKKYLDLTGDPAGIDFKLQDFGFRGVSSVESAAIGGSAQLTQFKGTDTLIALQWIAEHYGEWCAGFSIPASEHSTITSWGRDHEADAHRNMLDSFPDGLVASVSDSYDLDYCVRTIWGTDLRERVLTRRGTVVIRPDSGYPPAIVVQTLNALGEKFSPTVNAKGFKVLPPQVRVIQGDGVDYDTIRNVLHAMMTKGWSADNVAFGMGGALLQQCHRDTQRMAIKCSAIKRNDVWEDVYKAPKTDGTKISKAGRLKLAKVVDAPGFPDRYVTLPESDLTAVDHLQTQYLNGEIKVYPKFNQVRQLSSI